MDPISEFELFRAIVDAGGVTAAAAALQSSPPVVSRRLAALEARLGVRLADRRSRRFLLTDEGRLLYERCCKILEEVRDIEAEVSSRGRTVSGLLRLGAPVDVGRRFVAPLLAAFAQHHPGLQIHLVLSDSGLELGADGCDLILRFGTPDDPGVVIRKIAVTSQTICAAPSYLAGRQAPEGPTDLASHDCLRLSRRNLVLDTWHLRKGEEIVDVKVAGRLSSASGDVIRGWALAGEGVSLEASWDVAEDIEQGRLTRLLPDYVCPTLELFAVFAPGTPVPPRIRVALNYLIDGFAGLKRA